MNVGEAIKLWIENMKVFIPKYGCFSNANGKEKYIFPCHFYT
jgi:hypothetical protein